METQVTISNDQLIITPKGLSKLTSWQKTLAFPLTQVCGATIDTGILTEAKGVKAPGTRFPGYYSGTFHKDGHKSFFNISAAQQPVVIQLKNAVFDKLVIGVVDPKNCVNAINNAVL